MFIELTYLLNYNLKGIQKRKEIIMAVVKPKGENIQKATLFVMFTLFISRVLGFIREMIVAKVYGAGIKTDAFFAAFTIPDVMFNLLIAGALSSGFMPVFNQYLAKDEEDEAWKAASTFITVAIIFIIIFNIVGIVFARALVPLVAAGNIKTAEGYELTVKLTRIMFSAVTFTVLAGLLRGILNSYKIFTSPAVGPVLYNVGMILGALLLGKTFGIYGMAIGVIVGAILNFGVQYPDFRRVGKRFKFSLDTKNPGYRRMLRLMGPAIIGLSVNQLNYMINQNMASLLGPGSITVLRYASRIMLLPLGIFAMGVATTIFPLLNSHIARKEIESFKDTFSQGLRTVMFITIPATVGMIVLNVPIIRLLFKTGKFTEQDVLLTAFVLAFYSFGLLGQSGIQIITRGFYAVQDTKTPVKLAFLALVINAVLNYIFVKFSSLAIGGIAFSYSLTSVINMLLLYKALSNKINGLKTKETVVSFVKSCLASLIMAGGAFITSRFIESKIGVASKFAQLIDVGVAMSVGMVLYFGAAYMLKMSEMEYVLSRVKKKIRR
jgi:putative peptidoglycan lipid II flippase